MRVWDRGVAVLLFLLALLPAHHALGAPADLAGLFSRELETHYRVVKGELAVELLATYPPDLDSKNPTFLPVARLPLQGGVVTVPATYAGPNGKTLRGRVTVRLRKIESVLVTTTAVRVKETVEDKIVTERREVLGLPSDILTNPADAAGKVARLPLPRGTILTARMLEEPILVRRGEPVVMVAENSQVEIIATGEALMDGAMGAFIRVKNLESQKVLGARVVEKGKVRVELP